MSQYRPPVYQPPRPYQPPPPPYQPPPPSYLYPPQHVQHVVHHYQAPPKSSGTAVLLEILPGFFFQTFGIGHMYAGNVGAGLAFMFGYWCIQFINFLLIFVLIGIITMPLTFILAMILSPILASNAATRTNNAAGYR
jgi:TM2 domain-containing membrane protein YozV